MAHLARVSRDALYASHTQGPANTIGTPRRNVLTWQQQQQQQFGPWKSKNRKWKTLDTTFDTLPTEKSISSTLNNQPVPSNPSPLRQPHHGSNEDPQQTPSSAYNSYHYESKAASGTMIVSKSAYIPPHMRKQDTSPPQQPKASAPAQAVRQPTPPPSPPTTTSPVGRTTNNKWEGRDEPKPAQSTQPAKCFHPHWPKKVPAQKHAWPKNRDMRPLPSAGSGSDGGVEFKSNSNGDPDYDVKKLIDWNGDWLPPPVEWSARNSFADRHFGASIEKWMNGHAASCTIDLTDKLTSSDYRGVTTEGDPVTFEGKFIAEKVITKELAPRAWVPAKIEGNAPQQFWRTLPSRAPPALSDIDITEHQPYWEAYDADTKNCFLPPLAVPTALLDERDPYNQWPAARLSATEKTRNMAQEQKMQMKRIVERRSRPIPPLLDTPFRSNQLTLESNVYLRPVVAADAQDITDLYNYYITETVYAPEFLPRTRLHINERMHVITNEKLPFIVAVARKNRFKGPQKHGNERIVGFACIDDFCDKGSMYRYTFELEMFVHPEYAQNGIAKCMLDRLLEMVNTGYQAKGGYEWVNRGEYLRYGAGRVVKMINVNVPHDEKAEMEWMTKFMKDFGFRKAAHLYRMGYKLDKVIDVTIYQHQTTEIVDPAVPPREPL